MEDLILLKGKLKDIGIESKIEDTTDMINHKCDYYLSLDCLALTDEIKIMLEFVDGKLTTQDTIEKVEELVGPNINPTFKRLLIILLSDISYKLSLNK